jgi:hypothetical protein
MLCDQSSWFSSIEAPATYIYIHCRPLNDGMWSNIPKLPLRILKSFPAKSTVNFNMKCYIAGSDSLKVVTRGLGWRHRHKPRDHEHTSHAKICTLQRNWRSGDMHHVTLNTQSAQHRYINASLASCTSDTFNLQLNNDPAISTMRGNTYIDAVFASDVDELQTCNYISYFGYHKP